jgi:hypothetical protein
MRAAIYARVSTERQERQHAYFGGIRPLISGESAPLFRSQPPCRFGDFAHTWE